MYKWNRIKILNERGLGRNQISKELKISVNTVSKYLKKSSPPAINVREYKSELEKYVDKICEMLKEGLIVTRIYNELRVIGYSGSISSIYRYIKKHDLSIKKEREKITTRVETEPGKQMQYDWKEWELVINENPIKVYIHGLVMSYSRKKYYTYSLGLKTINIIKVIEEGINYFGGYAGELVIDNAKSIVISHTRDGVIRYNDEFLKFCGIYKIEPFACKPYRARTKGKVERPFYYLQEHFLRGLKVNSLWEFENELRKFTDNYNSRIHSKLNESPDDRFWEEMKSLKEIPEVGMTYKREIRKVSNDGYISYEGSYYYVPMQLCIQEVLVECGKKISIYKKNGELSIEHEINISKKRPEHPEHESMNKNMLEKRSKYKTTDFFCELFPENGKKFLTGLKDRQSYNYMWHISEILDYANYYSVEDIESVLAMCIDIGASSKESVKRLLGSKKVKIPPIRPSSNSYSSVNIKRDLSVYRGMV